MKIDVVYVYPMVQRRKYDAAAMRFAKTWRQFPPGAECALHVVTNGSAGGAASELIFQGLGVQWLRHNNVGKDIGAFQKAALELEGDLMVCLGAEVHFRRAGWLKRIEDVVLEKGPGLYGAYCYRAPALHVRTSAFFLPPQLLNAYPDSIMDYARYEFEHGNKSLTRFVLSLTLPVLCVTWTQVLAPEDWNAMDNSNLLFLDQHTDRHGIS